jgi:hypothetical protein
MVRRDSAMARFGALSVAPFPCARIEGRAPDKHDLIGSPPDEPGIYAIKL